MLFRSSFKEACDVLGLVESEIIKPDYDKKYIVYVKLCTVIEALNDGWKSDFNNRDQIKYYNWFQVHDGLFVFYSVYYDSWNVNGPAALHFKSEKLALYAKDNFFELYKQFYL